MGSLIVLGRGLGRVIDLHLALYAKVDELPNGHARVHADRLSDRNLECPVVAESDVPLAGSGMDVYPEAPHAGLPLEKRHVTTRLGILLGHTKIGLAGMKFDYRVLDLETFDFVVSAGIEDVVEDGILELINSERR